jgi:clan AA aspartic protease
MRTVSVGGGVNDMITGTVTSRREARIRVVLRGPGGVEREVDALIDTGFTGMLTLPPTSIMALGLSWLGSGSAVLADGSEVRYGVYEATTTWDESPCRVTVYAVDSEPLIGMALLYGCELRIQVVEGGSLTIEYLA